MTSSETIYRARKVWRDGGALLDNGALHCRNGRIVAVSPWSRLEAPPDADTIDLGDVLLLPGLVNAHTHLRLTHLKGKIPSSEDFVGWLSRIAVGTKLTRASTLETSIKTGLKELIANGITTAVEIDVDEMSAGSVGHAPVRLVLAHECIGLNSAKAQQRGDEFFGRLAKLPCRPYFREHGAAPHAPYSVCPELWRAMARHLQESPRFLTIHIAESVEEQEMVAEAKGALYRSLRLFGLLPSDWNPPGSTPVEYLENTGILHTPGLAVHCGQATDSDAERLARHGWTVAFCPGTHEYFQRPPWPLDRFRRAGVPVCIATDSAASNTGLSMMDEMRRFARMFPTLDVAEIVEAATTLPARAIGWGEAVGRIEPGYFADLSAWAHPPEGDRLERKWFEGDAHACMATVLGGDLLKR